MNAVSYFILVNLFPRIPFPVLICKYTQDNNRKDQITPFGILLNTFLLSFKSSVLISCFLLLMSVWLEKLGICDIHNNLVSLLYFIEKLVFYAVPIL